MGACKLKVGEKELKFQNIQKVYCTTHKNYWNYTKYVQRYSSLGKENNETNKGKMKRLVLDSIVALTHKVYFLPNSNW